MKKKLEWTKPILVELGSARRMSFGQGSQCHVGTGANTCGAGNGVIEE